MKSPPIDVDSEAARSTEGSAAPVSAPALPRRIPSLDGLRAFSIALVLLGHTAGTRGAPGFLERLHLEHFGNLGVKVFFVISGFLITTLLLREKAESGRISLKGFYVRRVLRIFPAFYAYVGVVAACALLGLFRLKRGDLLHAVTYTMNYHGDRGWQLNHLWSLAVEEQFYLIWPCVLRVAGVRRGLALASLTLVAAPAARAVMWCLLGSSPAAVSREFQAVSDSLAVGCLLAGSYNWLGARPRYLGALGSGLFPALPLLAIALAVGSFGLSRGVYYVVGQSVVNVAIALIVDRCVRFPDTPLGRLLNWRPLAFVGVLSYSLYLWQELFLNPMDVRSAYTAFPGNLLLAVAAALASYYLVELPFLRLKSRL